MFMEMIETRGLAHRSWLIGSGREAAVIDPRRDCEVYLELAARHGARIVHIFETHRHEDFVSGAPILGAMAGAKIFHGPNPAEPVRYAQTTREGESFRLGELELRVLETPGHTDDSVSLVVIDHETGDSPIGVFTGDALFVGDVGRTDFYPDRAREVAGALFDSLQKLLSLGDQAMVYPAHGAGSVCGSGMAARSSSTIGYERMHNPRLGLGSREEFIEAKLAEEHVMPPYFARMEELNSRGGGAMPRVVDLPPLGVEEARALVGSCVVVDVRSPEAFIGAHIPGSLALASTLVSGFAGWLLGYEDELLLVADDGAQARAACVELGRMGYDRVRGWLAPGLRGWTSAGHRVESLTALQATAVSERLREPPPRWRLLDVRSPEETARGVVPGATPIYVGELQRRVRELDPEVHHTVMCASGLRATLGASVLRRHGVRNVDLYHGALGHLDAPLEGA